MLDNLKELSLQKSLFIPLLGLFQAFSSVLSTLTQLALKLSCGLSLPYTRGDSRLKSLGSKL